MKIVCSLALMPIASLCFVQREPKEEAKSFGNVMEDNKLLTMAYFLDEIVSFDSTQKWSWVRDIFLNFEIIRIVHFRAKVCKTYDGPLDRWMARKHTNYTFFVLYV